VHPREKNITKKSIGSCDFFAMATFTNFIQNVIKRLSNHLELS